MNKQLSVAPLVGAWIETPKNQGQGLEETVAPLVGAWIETVCVQPLNHSQRSHPSWVRGLKHGIADVGQLSACRTPRGCVD